MKVFLSTLTAILILLAFTIKSTQEVNTLNFVPGRYQISPNKCVASTLMSGGESFVEYESGDIVNVVEVVEIKTPPQIRGKLEINGLWITLQDLETGVSWVDDTTWYKGAYIITANACVASQSMALLRPNEQSSGEYRTGNIVNVVDVKKLINEKRIRGKLSNGLWITLQNLENGLYYASPVINSNCPANHGLKSYLIPEGHMPGAFSCDGCKNGFRDGARMYGCRICNFDMCMNCYVPGFRAGKYKISPNVCVASRSVELLQNWDPYVVEYATGDIVNVVEVRELENANRIRGKLDNELWISLLNTKTGFSWVNKLSEHTSNVINKTVTIDDLQGEWMNSDQQHLEVYGNWVMFANDETMYEITETNDQFIFEGWVLKKRSTGTVIRWKQENRDDVLWSKIPKLTLTKPDTNEMNDNKEKGINETIDDDNVNLSKVYEKVVKKEKYKEAQSQSNKKLNGEKSVNDVLDKFTGMNVGIEEKSSIENSSTSKVWSGDKIDEEKDNVINKQTFDKKGNNKRKRTDKNKK